MRHFLTGIAVAILACLIFSSSASAITIYEVRGRTLDDPLNWWDASKNGGFGFGAESYTLMWNKLGPDGKTFLAGGRPTGDYTGSWAGNPAWLNFKTGSPVQNTGSGPYQPSGILSGTVIPRLYTLESWDANRRFDFSVYFFDPGITATGSELVATVILSGNFGTTAGPGVTADPFNVIALTADQVRAGTMATFDVGAEASEQVGVTIETKGTYAAGFFLDNIRGYSPTSLETSTPASTPVVPEPVTITMLALGLGGLVMRRRRR
ncbi:MAG: PEP-CTERM sorting domain-containing protein [Planctomycetota bacterium]|nr:PEP-CTERM sorting domain-containing protein [Planctomycetota bacterium]